MTTYYVDGVNGSNANAGTSEGSGNAWLTIDHAMNTAQTAGDIVYVKAGTGYTELATIDVDATGANPITYIGYTTTPGDDGKVTWTGTTNCIVSSATAYRYYVFKNFIFTGSSSYNVNIGHAFWFINCESINCGQRGVTHNSYVTFYKCIMAGNSAQGIHSNGAVYINVIGCKLYGNGDEACFYAGAQNLIFVDSLFYGNATNKNTIYAVADYSVMVNCTIDGENTTGSGLYAGNEAWLGLVNNIFYDAAEGYECTDTGPARTFAVACNNLFFSNTTNYSNGAGTLTYPGYGLGDVLAAPAFTDEAGDDYTLGPGSAAIDAGCTPGGVT